LKCAQRLSPLNIELFDGVSTHSAEVLAVLAPSALAADCGRMTGNSDVIRLGKACRQYTRRLRSAMKVQRISVGVAQTGRDSGEAGFEKNANREIFASASQGSGSQPRACLRASPSPCALPRSEERRVGKEGRSGRSRE